MSSATARVPWRRILIPKCKGLEEVVRLNHLVAGGTQVLRSGSSAEIPPEIPPQTMSELKLKMSEFMGVKRGYQPFPQEKTHLLQYLPETQNELPTRTPKDSFEMAIVPLSSNPLLQEKYVTAMGGIRTGLLMEDMDHFAVWVTHRHLLNPKKPPDEPTPYVIVTILVDQIEIDTDIIRKPDQDMRVCGFVSWVGKSSLEISIWMEQFLGNKWRRLVSASFLMAARNSSNTGPAVVNKLVPVTDNDRKMIERGEQHRRHRQDMQSVSLFKVSPNAEEQKLVHNLFLRTVDLRDPTFHRRVIPKSCMWMESAAMNNVVFCYPENKNLHNKVFGGYLMRQAYQLAWTLANVFCKIIRPQIVKMSDIKFNHPVEVGSMLNMFSQVTYTEREYFQVMVRAEISDPRFEQTITSNVFHYTFRAPDIVTEVIPKTYNEAMMYLDGRRHFKDAMGLSISR